MADICDPVYLGHMPQIIGRGEIYAGWGGLFYGPFHCFGSYFSRNKGVFIFGIYPFHLCVKEHAGIEKRPVAVANGSHTAVFAVHKAHGKHCENAESRAACGVKCLVGMKYLRGVFLAFGNDAVRFEKTVGALYLGYIKLGKEKFPFVPRHMGTDYPALCVIISKILYGGVH